MNHRHNGKLPTVACLVVVLALTCSLVLSACWASTAEPTASPTGSVTAVPTSPLPDESGTAISGELRDLAVATDGTVWAATGRGLMRLGDSGWENVLESAEIHALAIACDGAVWAGVGCQIQRLDGDAWEIVFPCGEYLAPGNVLDIAFTPDGAAWIANGFGLASFDGSSWTTYDRLINSLVVAPDGALWMNGWEGTQGSSYVARLDGEEWTTLKGADAFPGGFLVGGVTPDGMLWGTVPERRLASFDGGSWGDEESWTLYSSATGVPLDEVSSMAVAPDGALWVGTRSGAARFDGEWIAFAAADAIRSVAFGSHGEVWLNATVLQPEKDDPEA